MKASELASVCGNAAAECTALTTDIGTADTDEILTRLTAVVGTLVLLTQLQLALVPFEPEDE